MKTIFGGLRGKLILTYTMVTVLALLALEVLVMLFIFGVSLLFKVDQRNFLNDVMYTIYPQASEYIQPGKKNLSGLQSWLEGVSDSGYASSDPIDLFDSPAAKITPGSTMLVMDTNLNVLAQVPNGQDNLIGKKYSSDDEDIKRILFLALDSSTDSIGLSVKTDDGKTLMAVPVFKGDTKTRVVGVILLTLEPTSPIPHSTIYIYMGVIVGTGLLLLMAVAPFGALFGFIMSSGLTKRLTTLTNAADAWSEGDFCPMPVDKSRDEIGILSMRMRNMAERIQALLHNQQQLAVMEERNRLARDLHDTVKQQSFATFMQIRAARNLLESNPVEAEKHLKDAEALIKMSQQELNLLITELRPAELEAQGLCEALRVYLKSWYNQTGIPANLQVTGERRLPLAMEQAFFRLTQEALSNIARHSRATLANVEIDMQTNQVCMDIFDNGIGFDPLNVNGRGFGLESMRDRVKEIGGQLEIKSAPDQGTHIDICVPLTDKG